MNFSEISFTDFVAWAAVLVVLGAFVMVWDHTRTRTGLVVRKVKAETPDKRGLVTLIEIVDLSKEKHKAFVAGHESGIEVHQTLKFRMNLANINYMITNKSVNKKGQTVVETNPDVYFYVTDYTIVAGPKSVK